MKMKEESEKDGLKLNIQKTKIMASGPIASWQIDAETVETVTEFIFLGSRITADGECSHEIKKYTHMAIIHVRVFCICCVLRTLYFGHLMRTDSFEKILMMGKVEGRRRRG